MRTIQHEDDIAPWERGRHIVGLDLGQASDPSALSVLRRTPEPNRRTATGDEGFKLDCVMLERFPLGTDYPSIVRSVSALMRRDELLYAPEVVRYHPGFSGRFEDPLLVLDSTGVGRAVVDMFLEADLGPASVLAVTITSGRDATEESWHGTEARHAKVPKLQLVSVIQAGLQSGRLKIVPGLEHAETLKNEMLKFKVKVNINTGHEGFEAWRERDHDDLLLSVAIAAWAAARPPVGVAVWGPDPFGDFC